MSLALRNLLFTIIVPASGAVYVPWWILSRGGAVPQALAWVALLLIVPGYEEPALRARFGDEYDDYRRRVWRWLPRPPPTNHSNER
jgi:protein-S-isoprenylcysteine O-methyltransferase Ste14